MRRSSRLSSRKRYEDAREREISSISEIQHIGCRCPPDVSGIRQSPKCGERTQIHDKLPVMPTEDLPLSDETTSDLSALRDSLQLQQENELIELRLQADHWRNLSRQADER